MKFILYSHLAIFSIIMIAGCKSTQSNNGKVNQTNTINNTKEIIKKTPEFKYTSPIDHKGKKNRFRYENITKNNEGKIIFIIKDDLNFYQGSKSFELYHFEQYENREGKAQQNHYYFTGYYKNDEYYLTLSVKYKFQIENNIKSEDTKGGTVVYQIQEFSDKNVRAIRDDYKSNYSIPFSSAKNYFKFED